MRWMGIDGGGSNLRIVIVDNDLNILASHHGEAVNPSSVGRELAAERIRNGIHELMRAQDQRISAVGIGVAGASAIHAADWLRAVLEPVLPDVPIVTSSDEEIALVGARGEPVGAVLLAGTGSVAYGINSDGRIQRAGGWGYLLGDEGSGYWIGLQALRLITDWGDSRLAQETALVSTIMQELGLTRAFDLIAWTYQKAHPRDIAALAPLVLELAEAGDKTAMRIISEAAEHLAALVEHVCSQLGLGHQTIVYAGSLLTRNTPLCRAVTQRLGLETRPEVRYPAAVGAALLAKIRETQHAD